MGILDTIKNALRGSAENGSTEFDRIITATRAEHDSKNRYAWGVKIKESDIYKNEVSAWPDKKKIDFIVYCADRLDVFSNRMNTPDHVQEEYGDKWVCEAYVPQLFKTKLIMDDTDVGRLHQAFTKNKKWSALHKWPVAQMLNQIGNQYKKQRMSDLMISNLAALKADIEQSKDYADTDKLKLTIKIDELIYASAPSVPAQQSSDIPDPKVLIADFERIIASALEELGPYGSFKNAGALSVYKNEVAQWPDKKKAALTIYCAEKILISEFSENSYYINSIGYQESKIYKALFKQFFKEKIKIGDQDMIRLVTAISHPKEWEWNWVLVTQPILTYIEAQAETGRVSDGLLTALASFRSRIVSREYAWGTENRIEKIIQRIDAISRLDAIAANHETATAASPSFDPKEFEKIINDSTDQSVAAKTPSYAIDINTLSPYTKEVVKWTDPKKMEFAIYLVQSMGRRPSLPDSEKNNEPESTLRNMEIFYFHQLFRAGLIIDDLSFGRMLTAFIDSPPGEGRRIGYWPIQDMLTGLKKQYKGKNISEGLARSLTLLRQEIDEPKAFGDKYKTKLFDQIDQLIATAPIAASEIRVQPRIFLGEDGFSPYANASIEALPQAEKNVWYQLISKAQKASGSKPSQKYLNETKVLIKELGTDKFKKIANDWFAYLVTMKEVTKDTGYYRYQVYLSDINVEAIKGFVWMCAHFHDSQTIHSIANLAERCYRKIPGKGPTAAAVGNACFFTLYTSKGLDGIGQLSRLKLRVKQSSTQATIEKYLMAAAKEQGVTLHEIEDLAVDDYDLVDGKREYSFDDYKAALEITAVGKSELRWFKPDGTEQKSVPALVKEKHAAKFKKVRATQKQIDQTTSAQRDRLDRTLRANRTWTMDNFLKLYIEHGLMSYLTKKIIWTFTHDGRSQSAIYLTDHWVDNKNQAIEINPKAEVTLWHPAVQTVDEVRNWRAFLMEHKFQQPLKQAYREVYLLTEAEINTRSYSNRMAAHVLKQHQFSVLAKMRGWRYSLIGAYDNGYDSGSADLTLPEYGLKAGYWVNELNANGALNDAGIWNYITTDQVRFTSLQTNEPVMLVDVPAIPLSEVLRDVDLFVGVASVGNDPTWQDSGGVPGYRDYWTSYSFGDLSEVAKNRKEILTNLVPRLKIKNVAEIKDKFLVVKGKLRTYKIHIGSTNILMEPNDQYLCIVPDKSAKSHTENLFIPFEGDAGLSIILSKAFLLADDDKIKDSTITSQINMI